MRSNTAVFKSFIHFVTAIVVVCLSPDASSRNALRRTTSEVRAENKQHFDEAGPFELMSKADELWAEWTEDSLRRSIELYERAAKLWTDEREFSRASVAVFRASEVRFSLSEYSQSLIGYQHAASLAARVSDKLNEARALSKIGLVLSYQGNNRIASQRLLKALHGLRDSKLERVALGETLTDFAEVSYARGDLTSARRQLRRARNLLREDPKGEARASLFSGYIAGSIGQYSQAISEISHSLELYKTLNNKRGEGLALTALGLSFSMKKEEERALELHRSAIKLFRRVGDRQSEGIAFNALGQAYENLNEYSRAIENYRAGLILFENVGSMDLAAVATRKVGGIYRLQGEYDESVKYYQRSLQLSRTSGKKRTEANALSELALLRVTKRNSRLSLNQFYDVLRFYRATGDRPAEVKTLNAIGNILFESARHREAEMKFREALRVSDDLNDKGLQIQTLFNLARVNCEFDSLETALNYIQRSLTLIENVRTNLESVDFRTSYFSGSSRHYELGIDILMKMDRHQPGQGFAERALLMSEKGRSRALVELINKTVANSREEDTFPPPTLAQMQSQLLEPDTTLLEYSLGSERSYLWVVTRDSLRSYELPGRDLIESATREVYELVTSRQSLDSENSVSNLRNADRSYKEKIRSLSQLLLGPAADQLHTNRLLIVADGALQYLPFDALVLPGERTEDLLIATREIVRLPSISTLLAIRARESSHQSSKLAAVIADPVFSRDDDRFGAESTSSIKTLTLNKARLPYAAEEVEAISALAPGKLTVLDGFSAVRENVLGLRLQEYRIIHFATHALIDNQNPELSGLLLTQLDPQGTERNGVMPLHDIYGLTLNSEVTVLSACQTALGKDVRGEGLIGLTHGFISAGSKSVVSSLWKVDDRATAYLMAEFYKLVLHDRVTPAQGLRQAKLKMIREGQWSAPYYWAGFVLQGEYTNRIEMDGQRRGSSSLSTLIALSLSIVMAVTVRNTLKRKLRSPR